MATAFQLLNGMKAGEKYTITGPSPTDGKPQEIGSFTAPTAQQPVYLETLDPAATKPWDGSNGWNYLEFAAWTLALAIIAGFGLVVLYKTWKGTIDLKFLVSESDGKASLSRFQALLFTFVFVVSLALIVERTGQFPTDVPPGVWALLGGSLGTYLISNGIQQNFAGGGSDPAFQPGGPMLRYGSDTETVLHIDAAAAAQKRQAASGEARYLVSAGNGGYGLPVIVASAVGQTKLTIVAKPVSGVVVKGIVRYGGASDEFTGQKTITTAAAATSDVSVEFSADKDGVDVPVVVTVAA